MTQSPLPPGSAAPPLPARPPRPLLFPRRVTGKDVVLALLAIVLAPAAAAVLVVVASTALGHDWLLGLIVPLATVVAGVAAWRALILRGWSWRDLGFVRGVRSLVHLWWEVPLVWAAALLLTIVAGTLAGLGPSGPRAASTAEALTLGVAGLVATQVCMVLLLPALEEILFRRVIYGWLEQRLGTALAVVGSALAFGLVHVAPPVIVLQFFIGLGAALLARAHSTLWAPLALHALNNGIVTAVVLAALR